MIIRCVCCGELVSVSHDSRVGYYDETAEDAYMGRHFSMCSCYLIEENTCGEHGEIHSTKEA